MYNGSSFKFRQNTVRLDSWTRSPRSTEILAKHISVLPISCAANLNRFSRLSSLQEALLLSTSSIMQDQNHRTGKGSSASLQVAGQTGLLTRTLPKEWGRTMFHVLAYIRYQYSCYWDCRRFKFVLRRIPALISALRALARCYLWRVGTL
ncbi:hypothetical protein SCHPADRAFT_406869 [Schizopora paradoxa]|uniref:Uncharacterized protein n=1 Tax=Schizopora paradoxa TaxID=27342 RepID=A0A0H2RLC6_9AGAM|nr:hypothetical protein SCHPADRAFT_406869 [Schizopora paradoxa]